jgi:hypothetical protein
LTLIRITNTALKRKLFVRISDGELLIDPEVQSLSGMSGVDAEKAMIIEPRKSAIVSINDLRIGAKKSQ